MIRVVAILETMWDWRSQTSEAGYRSAPRYFSINPDNYTGKRLYKLLGGGVELVVTNACKELVSSAKEHGTPDTDWLRQNLQVLDGYDRESSSESHQPFELLLVCGKVAQQTYKECGFKPERATVLEIPHPAARGYWTRKTISLTQEQIQKIKRDIKAVN